MIGRAANRADAPNGRLAWLDNARGIGIILVVYAHQLRAQAARGLLPASWDGPFQDALIYAFHMPLFFFISGIVSVRAIRGRSFPANLREKLITIAYPYFLWSIASWCLSVAAASYVRTPLDVENLLSIVYRPILQFWFLYVLFFCQVVAAAFGRVFAVNVVLALAMMIMPVPFEYPTVKEFVMSFPFFVIGMIASKPLLSGRTDERRATDGAFGLRQVAGALVMLACLVWLVRSTAADVPVMILARAWVGIAFAVMLARIIGPRVPWLAMLGQASMAIFVLHTIVAALLRTILTKVGVHDPGMMLAVCVIGSLLVPVAISKVSAKYGIKGLLGLGKSEGPARRPDLLTSPAAS